MALRAGIIGVRSFYSRAYASVLKQLGNVDLVAATALKSDDSRIKKGSPPPDTFGHEYGINTYTSAARMIDAEQLGMVCVCAKNTSRPRYAELAAGKGCAVFLAKPPCANWAGVRALTQTWKRHKIPMSGCSPGLYDGAIAEACARVKAGELGRVLTARVLIQHGAFNRKGQTRGTMEFDKGQGGPELSLGFYAAPLLRLFAGSDADRVYAEYDNLNTRKTSAWMDSGKMIVRFKDGKMGSADIIFSTAGCRAPLWEVEVVGSKGILRTRQSVSEGVLWANDGNTVMFYRNQNAVLLRELTTFVNHVVEGTPLILTMEDVLKGLEICFAWWRSAKTHKVVRLPLR